MEPTLVFYNSSKTIENQIEYLEDCLDFKTLEGLSNWKESEEKTFKITIKIEEINENN